MISFCFPVKMALSLPLHNRENALFTVEMIAERRDPIFAKQAVKEKRKKKKEKEQASTPITKITSIGRT